MAGPARDLTATTAAEAIATTEIPTVDQGIDQGVDGEGGG